SVLTLRLVAGARAWPCRMISEDRYGRRVFRLSLQDVSVVGLLSSEHAQECVGNCPIAGTLAPPLRMQAFTPFGPILTYGFTFPSHAPSFYAVMRGCYIRSNLRYTGEHLLVSFRECREEVVCADGSSLSGVSLVGEPQCQRDIHRCHKETSLCQ